MAAMLSPTVGATSNGILGTADPSKSLPGSPLAPSLHPGSPSRPSSPTVAHALLSDSLFPERPRKEDDQEKASKDPLATEVWRLYTRAKDNLPNGTRLENLTWRMMAMTLGRKKKEQSERDKSFDSDMDTANSIHESCQAEPWPDIEPAASMAPKDKAEAQRETQLRTLATPKSPSHSNELPSCRIPTGARAAFCPPSVSSSAIAAGSNMMKAEGLELDHKVVGRIAAKLPLRTTISLDIHGRTTAFVDHVSEGVSRSLLTPLASNGSASVPSVYADAAPSSFMDFSGNHYTSYHSQQQPILACPQHYLHHVKANQALSAQTPMVQQQAQQEFQQQLLLRQNGHQLIAQQQLQQQLQQQQFATTASASIGRLTQSQAAADSASMTPSVTGSGFAHQRARQNRPSVVRSSSHHDIKTVAFGGGPVQLTDQAQFLPVAAQPLGASRLSSAGGFVQDNAGVMGFGNFIPFVPTESYAVRGPDFGDPADIVTSFNVTGPADRPLSFTFPGTFMSSPDQRELPGGNSVAALNRAQPSFVPLSSLHQDILYPASVFDHEEDSRLDDFAGLERGVVVTAATDSSFAFPGLLSPEDLSPVSTPGGELNEYLEGLYSIDPAVTLQPNLAACPTPSINPRDVFRDVPKRDGTSVGDRIVTAMTEASAAGTGTPSTSAPAASPAVSSGPVRALVANPASTVKRQRSQKSKGESTSGLSAPFQHPDVPITGPTCSNCSTRTTPLWRRDPEGQPLCNACGLFLKLHGVVRPLSLKTDVIKKRNRSSGAAKHTTASSAASTVVPSVSSSGSSSSSAVSGMTCSTIVSASTARQVISAAGSPNLSGTEAGLTAVPVVAVPSPPAAAPVDMRFCASQLGSGGLAGLSDAPSVSDAAPSPAALAVSITSAALIGQGPKRQRRFSTEASAAIAAAQQKKQLQREQVRMQQEQGRQQFDGYV